MMNAPEQSSSISPLRRRDTESELDGLRRLHQALGQQLLAVLNATAGRDRTTSERAVIDGLLLEMQRTRIELNRAGT
jgi:hypothetical protein